MVLLQVVQCLTELGLSVKQARISSDGGWFVDGGYSRLQVMQLCRVLSRPNAARKQLSSARVSVPCYGFNNVQRTGMHLGITCGPWLTAEFHVSETPVGRVTDPKKLAAIKRVLSLPEHTGAILLQLWIGTSCHMHHPCSEPCATCR